MARKLIGFDFIKESDSGENIVKGQALIKNQQTNQYEIKNDCTYIKEESGLYQLAQLEVTDHEGTKGYMIPKFEDK